ncbi:unnamed protein product, partial [marine sediment metagenome]
VKNFLLIVLTKDAVAQNVTTKNIVRGTKEK